MGGVAKSCSKVEFIWDGINTAAIFTVYHRPLCQLEGSVPCLLFRLIMALIAAMITEVGKRAWPHGLMATPNFKEGRGGFYHMLGRTTDTWRTALMTTTGVIY